MFKHILISLLPQFCFAGVISKGKCDPNVRGMVDFHTALYLGQWYEYSNTYEVFEDLPLVGKCVRAKYTDEGDKVGVLNEHIDDVIGYSNIKGHAHLADPNDPLKRGELVVEFFGPTTETPNYNVISTDYTSYSVVYDCANLPFTMKYESLWLLTRDQFPSTEAVEAAEEVMRANNLPIDKIEKTQQT